MATDATHTEPLTDQDINTAMRPLHRARLEAIEEDPDAAGILDCAIHNLAADLAPIK